MKRLLVFHLYNDYSGSPKVLETILSGLTSNGCGEYTVDLVTSRGGVLDDLDRNKVSIHYYDYKFSKNKFIRFFRFLWAQLAIFRYALSYGRSDCVFYINTILPFSASCVARLLNKKIIYHYHENAFIKSYFYRFLAKIMERLADKIICVSSFQQSFLIKHDKSCVIPNGLPDKIKNKLNPNSEKAFCRKNILFVGSLKRYKGINEFVRLASSLPNYTFTMVVSASMDMVESYFHNNQLLLPRNLYIYSQQSDVTPFYNDATITVNLSNKRYCLETFGLTVIESFGAGIPVIVPTVGGIAELVTDGYNGYKIDVENLTLLRSKIEEMLSDRNLYLHLSTNALQSSQLYSEKKMLSEVENVVNSVM